MPFSSIIAMEHVEKNFPVRKGIKTYYVHAMRDISLNVRPGEIISIVGESGSGKTTLLRVLARIYTEDEGKIKFKENVVPKNFKRKEEMNYRREIQMIFQDPFSSLNPIKSIYKILKRPLELHHFENVDKRVKEALEEVELIPVENFLNQYPHELSGGQRQRVVIARSIITRPSVILADEPTSMLDVSIRAGIMKLLLKIRKDLNTTYLHVTHDLASARYISDRIAVMYAGMIVEEGNADDTVLNPLHPYTQLLRKAAPDPDNLGKEKLGDTGEVPDLINPPKGCPFEPRCKSALDKCKTEMPSYYNVKNRRVRCFLYEKSQQHDQLL
ncbi:chemotaxis protein [Petrotoga sp. 9PW.55.5.1]|uniref:ABC transporter ATP-binding protein n=1 Tax=Petrotoga sp. 9PW.55.5.1 TaxID=1308979 RepID=UPI000DC273E7|nr:ABC transporter ATP-binding protein [Petrotoga sp. 9PW.55.5.1]RAO99676.1 chemotaxis protein [Petrotoga sp. 9PW.55.5.1]